MTFTSMNPATGAELSVWEPADADSRNRLLDKASTACREYRERDVSARATTLRAVGQQLRDRREDLALIATREMGKPLTESRAEVDKCAGACDFFAENGPSMLADEPHPSDAPESYVSYLPLGVIFAVMPWNFPYWQVFRHAAPALAAGNAIVVKHAENTFGVAAAIADVVSAAGLPGLVLSAVVTAQDSASMIADPRIAAVTLTGSTRAGASVAATAGKALKKSVLELGGSDAFVVLEDADVEAAARTGVASRFQNTGQSCIAAKRFIVHRKVAAGFIDAFVAGAAALSVGNPEVEGTDLGPMARADLRDELARQYEQSRAGGAVELLAGGPRSGPGWFFDPVVARVPDTRLPVWREETFGPLAPIFVVDTDAAALAAANDSDYGLGGNVWTADLDRGKAFARRMESGAVFINGMTASQPGLPFGGVKKSGYGRELARIGAREFTNRQAVWVGPPGGLR